MPERGASFDSRTLVAKSRRFKIIFLICLGVATLVVVFLSLIVGPSSLSAGNALAALFGQGEAIDIRIVYQIRMPRILAGIIAGAALSLSGLIMQTTLGNSMASPSTLGVSNAAIFGANVSIILLSGGTFSTGNNTANLAPAINPYFASGLAFVFATLSVLLILGLSTIRRFAPNVVVLAGIAIGAVWTGLTTLVQFFATDVGLSAAVVWSVGDLGRATYSDCILMGSVTLACFIFFLIFSWRYNALLAGEGYAKSIGVKVEALRFVSLLLASLLTAVSISKLGAIGFIGIICPHTIRRIVGNDHRYLIPGSFIAGSFLLLASDTVGRSLAGGASVPVGAVTALIGAPFFLYLVFAKKEPGHA